MEGSLWQHKRRCAFNSVCWEGGLHWSTEGGREGKMDLNANDHL